MHAHHRKARASLRFPILCGIATVILAACSILLYVQYASRVSLAEEAASRVFMEATTGAVEQVDFLLENAIALARVAPSVKGIGDAVPGDGEGNPALDFLTSAVASTPSIYAAYYGLEDGSFLEIIATHGNQAVIAALAAPDRTAYVLRAVTAGEGAARMQSWIYMGAAGTVLGRKDEANPAFDARKTDWYRRVQGEDGVTLSLPYQFSSIPVLGMTVVQALPGHRGVFGIDFTLSELSRFVAGLRISANGAVYLFDDSLRLIAAPPDGANGVPTDKLMSDMRPLGLPVLQALAELSLAPDRNRVNSLRIQSTDYLASISPWHGTGGATINIGVAAPLDDFAGAAIPVLIPNLLAAAAALTAMTAVVGLVAWFRR
jgi:hypothetical protein